MKILPITIAFISFAGLAAADTTVVVTPTNMAGWAFYSTDSSGVLNTGSNTGQMVFGPGTPPLGAGSANFIVPNGAQSEQLRGGSSFDGTMITALTSLSYSTYATQWNGSQLPYLQLYINNSGGTTVDQRLVFEPAYSSATAGNGNPNPPQGPVSLATWQTWNALTGMWYTTSGSPNANAFPTQPNGPGNHAVTWGQILTAFPNAVIVDSAPGVGGIRFTSGLASSSFNTNIDAFTIGVNGTNTTYNFEAVPEPSTYATGAAAALTIGFGAMRRIRARSGKA